MSTKSIFLFSIMIVNFIACSNETKEYQKIESAAKLSQTEKDYFLLQEGDLLFQDSDCGPFCAAIEKVTHGVNGANFSHVGMVIQGSNSEYTVLEAVTQGVIETSIDTFLNRSYDEHNKPKVLVGRLKPKYQSLIQNAVKTALKHKGKAYDDVFDINNDKYYCSELIYYAFKEANNGTPIFQLRAMTYKDPSTKKTFPIWEEYFQKLGAFIPEGMPGLNPGSMSRSIYLDIVHAYGRPDGWRGN